MPPLQIKIAPEVLSTISGTSFVLSADLSATPSDAQAVEVKQRFAVAVDTLCTEVLRSNMQQQQQQQQKQQQQAQQQLPSSSTPDSKVDSSSRQDLSSTTSSSSEAASTGRASAGISSSPSSATAADPAMRRYAFSSVWLSPPAANGNTLVNLKVYGPENLPKLLAARLDSNAQLLLPSPWAGNGAPAASLRVAPVDKSPQAPPSAQYRAVSLQGVNPSIPDLGLSSCFQRHMHVASICSVPHPLVSQVPSCDRLMIATWDVVKLGPARFIQLTDAGNVAAAAAMMGRDTIKAQLHAWPGPSWPDWLGAKPHPQPAPPNMAAPAATASGPSVTSDIHTSTASSSIRSSGNTTSDSGGSSGPGQSAISNTKADSSTTSCSMLGKRKHSTASTSDDAVAGSDRNQSAPADKPSTPDAGMAAAADDPQGSAVAHTAEPETTKPLHPKPHRLQQQQPTEQQQQQQPAEQQQQLPTEPQQQQQQQHDQLLAGALVAATAGASDTTAGPPVADATMGNSMPALASA